MRLIDADALHKDITSSIDYCEDILEIIDRQPFAELPIKQKCTICPHCDNCDVNDDGTIEPMSDLIDRQAAIDAMTNTLWHYPNECYRNLNEYEFSKGLAELGLRSVPTAEPKKGKWIAKENRLKQEIFICSECKGWAYSPWIGSRKSAKKNWCKYAFCPNCGARMGGNDE